MLLNNRHGSVDSDAYRYGFQGQERDDEVKGEGNSYNYTYRMHDPRLGRFFAVDPLAPEYPHLTPYQFASNSPIVLREIEGLEGEIYTLDLNKTSPQLELTEERNFPWWPDAIEPDYKTVIVKGPDNSEIKFTFTFWGSTGAYHNGEFGSGPNTYDFDKFKENPLETLASGRYVSEDEIKANIIKDAVIALLLRRAVRDNKRRNDNSPLLLQRMRDRLLGSVSNNKLKSTIDKLWRPGAKVGSGSTGDAIRAENDGAIFVNSTDHTQKGREGLNTMRDLLKGNYGDIDEKDRSAVFEVIDDLTRDTGLEWKGLFFDYLNNKPLKNG